jgi:predicted nucleic acid-binding protein
VIVVDSAAIVDSLSCLDDTGDLRKMLATEELHAPALLDFEVVSALRGLALAGHLSPPRAQDLLTDYNDLPLRRWAFADSLRRRAFQLRNNISAYDAAYVALAETLECPLITRDARLARSTGHTAQITIY